MNKHAFLSASGAPAWIRCEVKPWREEGLPDVRNPYAEEGTKAHEMLEKLLKLTPIAYQNLDDEMYGHLCKTLTLIKDIYKDDIYLSPNVFSEQRLDISSITGEDGAEGTADVVIVKEDTLIVVDLKYGMGKIDAVENEQLLIYGAAALEKYDLIGDIKTLKLVISQPRLNHIDEWVLTREEVGARVSKIREIGERILAAKGGGPYLRATPGDKQCQFCKVKLDCPERRGLVVSTVANGFVNLDEKQELLAKAETALNRIPIIDDTLLATCMDSVSMIESWCAEVRKEVYKRLKDDRFSDPRYKLVMGREGNRKFSCEQSDIEDIAKAHGADEIYEVSLKSVAQMEKSYKKENPVFWAKVEPFIIRAPGMPVVAPHEDKRPAINTELDFQPLEESEFVESLLGINPEL